MASTEASVEAARPDPPPIPPVRFFMDGRVLPERCKLGRIERCVLCSPLMLRRTSKRLSDCRNDLRILCIRERAPPWSGEAVEGGRVAVMMYRQGKINRRQGCIQDFGSGGRIGQTKNVGGVKSSEL